MKYLIAILTLFVSIVGQAQKIDPNFQPVFESDGSAFKVFVQDDDRILVNGFYTHLDGRPWRTFARLLPDGDLDTTFVFDPDINGSVNTFATQADGKIVVVGRFTDATGAELGQMIRLNSDGSYDGSFTPYGITEANIASFKILENQKIVGLLACGLSDSCRYGVRMFMPDGNVDPMFDPIDFEYSSQTELGFIDAQSDNAIIVFGRELRIDTLWQAGYRIDSLGKIDPSFKPFEESPQTFIYHFDISESGHIGAVDVQANFYHLNEDGVMVSSHPNVYDWRLPNVKTISSESFIVVGDMIALFDDEVGHASIEPGTNGYVFGIDKQGTDVIVTGSFSEIEGKSRSGIARINISGVTTQTDPQFRPLISQPGAVGAIALQDEKILVSGGWRVLNGEQTGAMTRLLPDGSIDGTLNTSWYFSGSPNEIKVLSNGNFVVGSKYEEDAIHVNGVAFFSSNGEDLWEMTYPADPTHTHSGVRWLAVDQNENLYALDGVWTHSGGVKYQGLVGYEIVEPFSAYNSIDLAANFIPGKRLDGVLTQSDNKILVWGSEISWQGRPPACIVRFDRNGDHDASFEPALEGDQVVQLIEMTADGDFICTVLTSDYDPVGLIKLNATGAIDSSFAVEFMYKGNITVPEFIKCLRDEMVLVSGVFDMVNGEEVPSGKALLTNDGELIKEFLPEMGRINIGDVEVFDENIIYVAGKFTTSYGGTSLMRVDLSDLSGVRTSFRTEVQLIISPNPNNGQFAIGIPEEMMGADLELEIINLTTGQVVYSQRVPPNEQVLNVDSGILVSSTYVVRIAGEGRSAVGRFVRH